MSSFYFFATPLVLGGQLQLRLHLQPLPSLASQSAKPNFLSTSPSYLQKQYHVGDSYTLQCPGNEAQGTTLATCNKATWHCQRTLPRIRKRRQKKDYRAQRKFRRTWPTESTEQGSYNPNRPKQHVWHLQRSIPGPVCICVDVDLVFLMGLLQLEVMCFWLFW